MGPLGELVTELNFTLAPHKVDATVTRPAPNDTPVSTTGIWQRSLFEDQPVGSEFSSREPRRVIALRRDVLPELERGTLISAPEKPGGTPVDWQVDKIESLEPHYYVAAVIKKTSF